MTAILFFARLYKKGIVEKNYICTIYTQIKVASKKTDYIKRMEMRYGRQT